MEYEKLTIKMKTFKETQGLNEFDVRQRLTICTEIQKKLQDYYPDCQFFIYGSTINGYGTKISDLDLLFMPFPAYENENYIYEDGEIEDCPSVNDIKTGKISKEYLLKMNKTLQLAFVRKILRKIKTYQNLLFIQARCPIIKFFIPKLGVTADMSCGSMQVVYNTRLFQLFNEIDERVKDLTMYLRQWAKSLTVIQSGVLSSYAFSLLVIYFLQNTNPPILPTVKHLIEHSDSLLIIDGWKVACIEKVNKFEKSTNAACCGKLLAEFFSFYWKFDFSKVISIYYGKCLSAKDLFRTNDERIKDFEVTPLSIQDPYILSFNVSRNIKLASLSSFKQKLYVAKTMLHEEVNSSENNKLLFNETEYKKRMRYVFSPQIPEKASFFCIGFDLVFGHVPYNEKQKYNQKICQDLLDLLQYGLLIDCEVIDKNSFEENKSSDQENFELLISIQCAVFNRTDIGRSKVTEIPSIDCDSAQFESRTLREDFIISNYLIQTNSLLTCPEPFIWFICDCYKSNFDEVEDFVLTFIPLSEYKHSKSFFVFLKSYLSKKLLKLLLECETADSHLAEI